MRPILSESPPPGLIIAADPAPVLHPRPLRGPLMSFVRAHPTLVLGSIILTLLIALAILAPWLSTHDPTKLSPLGRLKGPSLRNWLGADAVGRDIWSRILYGARVSLAVGLSVALLASVGGLVLGIVAGFIRWADNLLMRVVDGMMSIPPILIAVALMALSRGSLLTVIVAITLAETPRVARLVRGTVLSLREQTFVDAAITSGSGTARILWRHILPNTLGPLTVQATYICASAMMTEAVLSFIGAGIPATTPSWGNIMADGRTLWQVAFHIILFPAIFLSLAVMSINLIGDGLRDILDPRSRRH